MKLWKQALLDELRILWTIFTVCVLILADIFISVDYSHQHFGLALLYIILIMIVSLLLAWLMDNHDYQLMQTYKLPFGISIISFICVLLSIA